MAVIINELEVITEQPQPPPDATNAERADVAQMQASRQLTPEVIQSVWQREMERCARSYAG